MAGRASTAGAIALAACLGAHAGQPGGYLSERLDNGLLVTILADPANPVVATQLWYHVGSANEQPDSRGFAHLFEHLMFGPTSNHDGNEYSEHHHRHGGDENAYTDFDETVYVSLIAPEYHAEVLAFEADRMVNLVLDDASLENEKKIVAEELRLRMENDPFSRVGVAALQAVLGPHPYAHTPGGTREDVAAATLEQCRRFYADYYGPQNAHLVIVGPVDPARTLAAVRELFGAIPAGGVTPGDVPPLLGWELPASVTLKEDLPPAEIAVLAYPLPPAAAEDHWPILVLQQLLGGGELDPFEDVLVTRRGKAVYASTAWLETRRGTALLFHAAFLPYRRKATALRLMRRTVEELGELEWLTDESLAAARRTLVRREMERVYFAEDRAQAIGQARWWLGDEALAIEAPRRIEAVTREQVAAAFRAYVQDGRAVEVYLKPEHVPLVVRLFGWLYPLVHR